MQHPDVYSVLVLDNRGWGNSEVPSGRYTYVRTTLFPFSLAQ